MSDSLKDPDLGYGDLLFGMDDSFVARVELSHLRLQLVVGVDDGGAMRHPAPSH